MATLDTDVSFDSIDDEYDTAALPLPPRRRVPVLTLVLAAGLVGAAMFAAGAEVQKHWGSTSAASATGGNASAFAGRTGAARPGATAGAAVGGAGGATVGTVSVINGSTLYVTDASGNTVRIVTTAGSTVSKTVASTVKGISPGDTVVVRGTAAKNGDVTAQSITVGGAGGGGFGGGGGGFGNGNGAPSGFGGGG